MKRRRRLRTHEFVDNPELRDDRTGQQYCLCGLAAENEIHTYKRREQLAPIAPRTTDGKRVR